MVNIKAIVGDWLGAVQAMDIDRIVAALADDFELEVEGLETPIGKQAVRSYLESVGNPYEWIELDLEKILASGHEAAVLVRARAKMRADLSMLGETLPTAGKKLDVVGALFLSVDDAGKITHMTRVRDTLEVVRQLGVSPERMRSLLDRFAQQFGSSS